jgi:heat shock protein HslJ
MALIAVSLVGCSGSSASPSAADADPASLGGTGWLLVEIGGETPPETVEPTLEFGDDEAVSGLGGCNQFNGSAEIGEGTIDIGPIASTQMACPDEQLTQLETDYLAALEGAETWTVSGDELVIDGATELRFAPG